ncbi:uncharacterized protein ISCGN_001276, partial [Ixodes scapularis]
ELRTQLSNVNASIEPLVPDGDVEENYARTIEYDDKIVTYIATIAQEVEELRRARPQAGTTRIHSDGDRHVATSKVKLPKLELQRFGGEATDWQPFWEQYKQAIHDNDSFSNAEKFLHLRERFGRTDVLIQEHLSQLLDLPAVRHLSEVWAEGKQQRALTRILFDGGSQRTFVMEELLRKLRLEVVGEEDITIYPFAGAENIIKEKRRRVRVWLWSQYSQKKHRLEALEIPEICSDHLLPESVVQGVQVQIAELADVTLPPAQLTRHGIDILIGAVYYWTLVSGEVQKVQGALVAVRTDFGWILQGPIPHSGLTASCSTAAVLKANLESTGIAEPNLPQKEEENEVVRAFTSSIKLTTGRYKVALPWKPMSIQLADNERVARKRLVSLTKKLLKDDVMLTEYDKTIRQYLQQGFAEKISPSADKAENRVYYMPHRAVLRPDSLSTK